MSSKTVLLDAVHSARDVMQSSANRVEDVADLLFEVGLTKLAERLWGISGNLGNASKALVDAYGEDLASQVRHGEQMAANMLSAALRAAESSPSTPS